jgi:hypothetical protein
LIDEMNLGAELMALGETLIGKALARGLIYDMLQRARKEASAMKRTHHFTK